MSTKCHCLDSDLCFTGSTIVGRRSIWHCYYLPYHLTGETTLTPRLCHSSVVQQWGNKPCITALKTLSCPPNFQTFLLFVLSFVCHSLLSGNAVQNDTSINKHLVQSCFSTVNLPPWLPLRPHIKTYTLTAGRDRNPFDNLHNSTASYCHAIVLVQTWHEVNWSVVWCFYTCHRQD